VPVEMEGCEDEWLKQRGVIEFLSVDKLSSRRQSAPYVGNVWS